MGNSNLSLSRRKFLQENALGLLIFYQLYELRKMNKLLRRFPRQDKKLKFHLFPVLFLENRSCNPFRSASEVASMHQHYNFRVILPSPPFYSCIKLYEVTFFSWLRWCRMWWINFSSLRLCRLLLYKYIHKWRERERERQFFFTARVRWNQKILSTIYNFWVPWEVHMTVLATNNLLLIERLGWDIIWAR